MKKYLFVLSLILCENACTLSQKKDVSKALSDTVAFNVKITDKLIKKLGYSDTQDEEKIITLKVKGVKVASGTDLRVFIFPLNQKNRDFSLNSPNYLTSISPSPSLYKKEDDNFIFEVKHLLKRLNLKKDNDLTIIVIPISNKSTKDSIHLKVNTIELY
jgi:uncharacterized protein with gpF-like domain